MNAKVQTPKADKRVGDLTAKDAKQVKGGKATLSEITFTQSVDKASPTLTIGCASDQHIR